MLRPPVHELGAAEANRLVIAEIERITAWYQDQVTTSLSWCKRIHIAFSFLTSLEGIVVTCCLICLSISALILHVGVRYKLNWAALLASFCLICPFLFANIVIFSKLRRAEQVRPFAQVREALRIWDEYESLPAGCSSSRLHDVQSVLWNPPSAMLVNIYREGRWDKIPDVMVAKGDIFKLHAGEIFPTAAMRVEVACQQQMQKDVAENIKTPNSSASETQSETYIRICESSVIYNKGDIFSPVHNSRRQRQQHQPTTTFTSFSESSSDNSSSSKSSNPAKRRWSIARIFSANATPSRGLSEKETSPAMIAVDDDARQGDDEAYPGNLSRSSARQSHEELHFSAPIRACPSLACCSFQATEFACTPLLVKFFERSLQTKAFERRRKTTFFEIADRIRNFLVRIFFGLLTVSIISNIFWSIWTLRRLEFYTFGVRHFAVAYLTKTFQVSVFLSLSFMPLVYRLLIEVTDVWGNARLQSLFQWLEDTRFNAESPRGSLWNEAHAVESFTSTTTSTSSGATSVDSRMSVSRLPLRNQFSELFAVLGQGLDGASNLLHTLNATTSVIFVDKDGLLTDTQMTVQEVCVAETLSRIGNRAKDTRLRSREHRETNIIRTTTSSTVKDPIRVSPGSAPPVPERVVFDVMPRHSAPDGQKFEEPWRAEAHIEALRPLAVLMASAKLPLEDSHFQDHAHAEWLFSLTIRELIQTGGIVTEAFKECACAVKSLCDASDFLTNRLTVSRFFMAVQSRIFKPVRHTAPTPTLPSPSIRQASQIVGAEHEYETAAPAGGKALFAGWLLREMGDASVHMVTKGQPKAILRRAQFYFDGTDILPITRSMRRSFLELTTQWKGNDLDCVAIGYRPLTATQRKDCLNLLDEHSLFVVDTECVSVSEGSLLLSTETDQTRSGPADQLLFAKASSYGHQILDDAWESQPFLEDLRPPLISTPTTKTCSHTKLLSPMNSPMSTIVNRRHHENKQEPLPSMLEGMFHRWTPISIFPGTKSTISTAPTVTCGIIRLKSAVKQSVGNQMSNSFTEEVSRISEVVDEPCRSQEMALDERLRLAPDGHTQSSVEIGGGEQMGDFRKGLKEVQMFTNYCNLVVPVEEFTSSSTVSGSNNILRSESFSSYPLKETDGLPLLVSLPVSRTPALRCPLVKPCVPHNHLYSGSSTRCPDDKKSTTNKDVGSVIQQLVNKQILLGMVAFKLTCPQELASRVDSFHEAGIRFVYMSHENTKKTKSVGRLLGLETDWNCLISLLPSPRSIVNLLGNVVVPSGIEDIRKHIKEVDNVPLQVSLFSNGTPQTMKEMLKILQENGEMVTCVGSAHRGSNFDLFDQANCSVSVALDPSPICRKCLGRRCAGRVDRHIFPTLPAEFAVGAALTSLQCSLQINMKCQPPNDHPSASSLPVNCPSDPRWLGELLYEAFKESRRIVDAIQLSIVFFAGISIGFIAPMLVLSSVLFLPPFFRNVSLTSQLLFVLPLISITLLYAPAGSTIMKEFPLRIADHEKNKHDIWSTCFSYAVRFFPNSFACLALVCYYFEQSIPIHSQRLINSSPHLDSIVVVAIEEACMKHRGGVLAIAGGWIRCMCAYQLAAATDENNTRVVAPVPILHTQLVCQSLVVLFTFVMSVSFIDRVQSLVAVPPTHNVYLVVVICCLTVFYVGGVCVELLASQTWSLVVNPHYSFYILLLLWIVVIVALNEIVKRRARNHQALQQKYQRLLFTTRLGMWSPK